MKLSQGERVSHQQWLQKKILDDVCSGVHVASRSDSAEFRHVVEVVVQYGKKEENLKPLLRYRRLNEIGTNIYWRFSETWSMSRTNKKIFFEFKCLDIGLLDSDENECLVFHWNVPCPAKEPYQPHLHVSTTQVGFTYRKIHIPLNQDWGISKPKSTTEYQAWLDKLFQFITIEFPRCLN